jgi:glycine cleavage system H lipoate-binding protein
MSDIEIKVPNIGDFKDVEVIEVLVKKGQSIKKNDPLITIESDKSSVEIPSSFDGKISNLNIKVGDKVSEGDLILTLEKSSQINQKVEQKPITAARILKFNRVDSSKISFLLSIPALAGASVLSLKDIFNQPTEFNYLVIIAIISSFILSFLTVKYFLIFINKFSMNAFVIYRIIIALVLFSLIY